MIDLHIHTTSSDGSDEPKEILLKAQNTGLQYISITDHDSVGAYKQIGDMKTSDLFNGTLIPGCEFSVVHNKMPIEILGYNIDIETISKSGVISDEWFFERENEYIRRMKTICKNMNIKLTESLCIKKSKSFATQVIHADLKKYPENEKHLPKEIWESVNAFYRTCINNENSPFFLNQMKNYPTVLEVSQLIHNAGGKAFLAHLYGYFSDNHEKLLNSIISLETLDGIECYHSLHDRDKTAYLLQYCKEHDLYVCGGSDYHGALKPNVKIGESVSGITIPNDILVPWYLSI